MPDSLATLSPSAGFAPIAAAHIETLILGSLPSRRSIELGQYYGHSRNAFWPIMGRLLGAGPEVPYERRARMLTDAGIGVWDVLASSIRPGSLDADIDVASATANDFAGFLASHRRVGRVFFNGRKAEELFRRKVRLPVSNPTPRLRLERLPSTSPANAAMSFEDKLSRWSAILDSAT